jgi:ech hydrogenase subunit D
MVFVEEQQLLAVDRDNLVAEASRMQKQGCRLVQICCTAKENFELTYTFDKDYKVTNLRLTVPASDPVVPSISEIYFCAFTYENELQDLFGLTVKGLKLDFKGTFYKLSVKTPFAPHPQQPAK